MSALSNVLGDVSTAAEISDIKRGAVLFFWARWNEASCGQMNTVFTMLADKNPTLTFAKVEAEQAPALSAQFNVEVVPTFLFLGLDGKVVAKVEGASPPEVAKQTEALAALTTGNATAIASASTPAAGSGSPEALNKRLEKLVRAAPVMLFMKGSADAPKCKFSRQVSYWPRKGVLSNNGRVGESVQISSLAALCLTL
jgi:hypothetical protein